MGFIAFDDKYHDLRGIVTVYARNLLISTV